MIAVTSGDPCGIGPEVILKSLSQTTPHSKTAMAVIGDHQVFAQAAKRLHRPLPSWHVIQRGARLPSQQLVFIDCGHRETFVPGQSSARAGRASLAYLDEAIARVHAGQAQALVTGPVTKWAIGRVAPTFLGHTEYLAHAMGTRDVVMMFISDALRVVLLTRHLPLRRVSHAINQRMLSTTLQLTHRVLSTSFGIAHPRLALCGLNPHAGEESRCGDEEQTVMRPVLRLLRRQGVTCDGPFAADGFFAASAKRYDAIVCAYHDQGLIPFKMTVRDQGCQLSVGLPIVRTSPDHGSALDIAGRGIAHPGSMRYALTLAARLTRRTLRVVR